MASLSLLSLSPAHPHFPTHDPYPPQAETACHSRMCLLHRPASWASIYAISWSWNGLFPAAPHTPQNSPWRPLGSQCSLRPLKGGTVSLSSSPHALLACWTVKPRGQGSMESNAEWKVNREYSRFSLGDKETVKSR